MSTELGECYPLISDTSAVMILINKNHNRSAGVYVGNIVKVMEGEKEINSNNLPNYLGQLDSESKNKLVVETNNCRRLWYREGNADYSSLDDLCSKEMPYNLRRKARFPAPVQQKKLSGITELINLTEEAVMSINSIQYL